MLKKVMLLSFLLLLFVSITGCNNLNNQSNYRNENISQIEIINDYINIRKEKSTNSEVIGKVYKGEIYTIISSDDSSNKWIEIETSNKIHGYISGVNNYVKYIESVDEKNNKYKTKYHKYEWKCDVPLSEIKTIKDNGMMDIQPKLFISKSGDLYQFSLNKKYSNEQNCKKIDSNVTFKYFNIFPNDRDLSLVVDNNNNFYYYETDLVKFSEYSIYHYNDTINFILKYPMNYISYSNRYIENAGSTFYGYYVDNNAIYKTFLYWQDNKTIYQEPTIVHQFSDEYIISIEGKVFKTDKAYYKIGFINKEKCDEYEDVECVEGLLKIDDISNHYNDIEYFNGNYIIFKEDNSIYTY